MEALLRSLHFLLALFISLKHLALAQEVNQFIYHGFTGANLSLNGIASIHPNGLLELTNTSKQQIGHAFFPFPFHFKSSFPNNSRSLSFSTNFVFAMVPETPTRGGHGIALTISPSTEFKGATATQYLGLFNSTTVGLSSNHLLAIELDAVRSPEFRDIGDNHVGIDVNNLTSIQSAPASYFSKHERENESLQLISGDPMQVWIDYDEMENLLNVTLAPVRIMKPQKPLLSTPINLSLVVLESMYVGFSSSTGSVSSHHYILGWSFNKSGQAQSLDTSKLPSLPPERNSTNKPYLRIMISLITASLLLIASFATMYIMRKRYEEVHEDWEQQYGPQRFRYKDLYKATKGFKDKGILGYGGFGRVYRGELRSSKRYQIIRGVASALLYLHEEWEQFHDHGSTPQTTNVVGTVGYLAPEITRTGKSTTCSDVFSFGTFMLEVACGRKPVESERPPEEVVLVDWVLECWKRGAILGTVDPRFEGNHVEEEMELVLKLGLLCTHRTPAARPSMRQAVQYLDGNATLPDLPVHGAGIGLVPVSNEASTEHVLTIRISSDEISSYSLSDSESILSGR
ncbi:hypothetical protein H0E87_017898 [Populus deltoides]|uniref:Protein kinase domain-containing protein n=1 Tax=Populus deltoides TaxID=3696 RepID=A0A8T2Y257_POPDE|nr:hypothetical protein H0E87_017898 [Populus deltoides]